MSLSQALDAADPPAPTQWVKDLDTAGADVAFVYIPKYGGGGSGHYTNSHVAAAKAAGKIVCPIVVPGSSPPAMAAAIQEAQSIGAWPCSVFAFDVAIGDNNFTDGPWLKAAVADLAAQGVVGLVYCQSSIRKTYPWGEWWQAAGPKTLPSGQAASQYAADVDINGSQYDKSIVDLTVFEETDMDATQAQQLQDVWDALGGAQIVTGVNYLGWSRTVTSELAAIQTKVDALSSMGGLTPAQAAQLTDIQTKLDALVTSLKASGTALGNLP
jgi:hypothetical protein